MERGGLPTPPTEEHKPALASRRSLKQGRPSNRAPKRSSAAQDHGAAGGVVVDGRHRRVWKACERCRMKKTKCDGESPCRRCKDDGFVCTAGSRKKTEYKQLPRGYAEVLENTQYALIATVQKLYAMVRGGEAWDLGEPELNDRGLPVIHNIAEKLGCIRRSPDMPQAFPEDAEEFAALQTQLFAAARDSSDSSEGKHSEDSVFSRLGRGDRASSSDTEHSSASNGYNQMFWEPEPELDPLTHDVFAPDAPPPADTPFGSPRKFRQELNPVRRSFNPRPVSSPPYTDLPGSSDFRGDSPFAAWSGGGEDFVSSASAVEMGSLYLQQAQPQPQSQPAQQQQRRRPLQNMQPLTTVRSSLGGAFAGDVAGSLDSSKGSVMSPTPSSIDPYANISTYLDGTIRPNMLDCDNCNLNGTLPDSMDNVMFGDYDGLTIV